MFKSLTEAVRSLWSPSVNESDIGRVPTGSKRKSTSLDRFDENGKRRRLESHSSSSSSTVTDYIKHSVAKMASWMKPKPKPFTEDFATRPRFRNDHIGKMPSSQENGSHTHTNHVSSLNSEGAQNHIGHFSSRAPTFNETSTNAPMQQKERDSFSRRLSETSMYGHRKQSMAHESMRLKEREQYRQLLQLHNQRSPWQGPVPMNPPGETSRVISPNCDINSTYSELPDSTNGYFQSRLDIAEELKKSAMSSLLMKQRSKLGLPAAPSSPPSSSARQGAISQVKPHHAPQQHLRISQDLNAQHSRTPRHRGMPLGGRYLVTRDGEKTREMSLVRDNVTNHGDTHNTGHKVNGDVDWDEHHTRHKEPETIVIDDEDEDEKIEQRVPPLKLSHTGPQGSFSLDSSRFQSCYKKVQAYSQEKERRRTEIEEEEMKAKAYEEKRRLQTLHLERQMKYRMKIFDEDPGVIEEIFVEEDEDEEDEQLPELSAEMMNVVKGALRPGNPNDILSDAFRLQITRRDMATLAGLNWLNDEVINFYMNMLTERGEKEGNAKVYAFNTFFYPKILSGGHAAVKRWTKKVDIFSVNFILIPVHLGMHWCLCVVDMPKKMITYYDSMGAQNNQCLQAVLNYINDESVAKKQTPIKKSDWTLINADDNPQQMNGSDCGMFMCKYAEYITRQKELTFGQEDMPYFRQRMVYEIISKKLLQ